MVTPFDYSNPAETLEFVKHLLVSVGIGLLIGLERQLSHRDLGPSGGGIRTFSIVSVFGFIAAVLASLTTPWFAAVPFLGLSIFVALSHFSITQQFKKGVTTEISLLLTFLLGMLVQVATPILPVLVALLVSVLMSLKLKIDHVVKQVTEEELFAVFKLLVVSVLIWPLLPNTAVDPYHVINPQEIWTVVVLVLSLSFVGYILVKFWGPSKGIILTGFMGGLVSSTVVTWIFSKKSKADPQNSRAYALATLLAISIMFARILILSEIVSHLAAAKLFLPFATFLAGGIAIVAILKRRYGLLEGGTNQSMALGNPFNVGDAVKFGLMFVAILFFVHYAHRSFGAAGVYTVSAVSGFASVDAIVISMARLGGSDIGFQTSIYAIVVAAMSNNLFKLFISLAHGSREYQRILTIGICAMFVVVAAWSAILGW